jgi:mannose-6-phosphate isomerase
MSVIRLPANQPPGRFYRGGEQIAKFRGASHWDEYTPEDWVASTVAVHAEQPAGLTRLPSGAMLTDAIAADPMGFLGPDHLARYGADPTMLVKLLDVGQRLAVHVHPDDDFAHRWLQLAHGKTEAWYFLAPTSVYLGFAREVSAAAVSSWIRGQQTDAMLGALNRLEVAAGESIVVPAGLPHSIGAGAFLVEIQQPSDLSIMMEWHGFAGLDDGTRHLGLTLEEALPALDRSAWDADRLATLMRPATPATPGVHDVLAPVAKRYFALERVVVQPEHGVSLDAGYSVVVVLDGAARLVPADGDSHDVRAGETLLITHRAGALHVDGDATLLRSRPPR